MANHAEKLRVAFVKTAYRKKIHIRMDDELHKKLRERVASDDTTIQNFITSLLQNALSS